MKKFLLISILLTPGVVFGATISGTVVDENGGGLAGAVVYAENNKNLYAETLDNGTFTINNVPDDVTQYCAHIMGYQNACTTIGSQLKLQPENNTLDDVVVTGNANDQCGKPGANAKYHATKTQLFTKDGRSYCAPANANSCAKFYKYENGQCVSIDGDDCTTKIANAYSATWLCDMDIDAYDNMYNKNCTCQLMPDGCELGYKEQDNKCIEIENKCTPEQERAISHGKTFELDTLTNTCHVLNCECGYAPDLLNEKCEKITETNCSADNAKTAEYTCKNNKQICEIKQCDDKYELKNNKCVAIAGKCTPDDPNAKSGRREVKDGKEICVVDSCKKNYEVQDGKCVLSNEHSEQELEEKSKKVNELREKEQSLANRMISGVSMGAAGIGGMMLAESLSEQRVDKESEQDMAAYLATFRCEYAGGKSVPGGTNGVQLPADKLFDLYQEYVTLATEVQDAKSQLGLKPGIESEVILDKANIGLYDDTSTGKTNGTYASVARALTDPNGTDAQKWNDQKAQTDKNLKIGIGVGVGGAAVGLVGNILTNHVDWDKIKDKVNDSKENKDKIKMLKDGLTSAGLQNVDKLDFSKLDLTEFDVNSIDFAKIKSQLGTETDATKLLNTTNVASWKSSFSKIYPVE